MATQGMQPPAVAQGQDQGQAGQQPQEQDQLGEFRSVAQIIMALGQKYPESAKNMADALRAIQGAMTQVAGNPQRTPQRQAPPQG